VPITIADVAARARVSKTTVSRVLNGKGELDSTTAERVRKVIEEMGYVPSSRAVGLARGRTRVVGMLIPSLTWPWIAEIMQGAVEVLEAERYGLLLFTCTRGEESIRRFTEQMSAKAFDGLLVIEPDGTFDFITLLHDRGLPVVLIDDRGHEPRVPSVATTNHSGAHAAAKHLLDLGRRQPLVITGPERFGCTRERLSGFAGAYADAGVPLTDDRVVIGDFTYGRGRDVVREALRAGLTFDAVFAHNDLSAAGAMQAVRDSGRRIPADVAVVGFDDIPLAAHIQPPLTTVHQPLREMGETAARLLLAHFGGRAPASAPTVIPSTLTIRGSTAGP
jgi:LacI family transcriptional regulator